MFAANETGNILFNHRINTELHRFFWDILRLISPRMNSKVVIVRNRVGKLLKVAQVKNRRGLTLKGVNIIRNY